MIAPRRKMMNARDIQSGKRSTELTVTPYSPSVGAVIEGLDLAQPISDAAMAQLRAALRDHGVIFLRNQHISPEQHITFARRWAPIDINRFFKAVPGYPEIAQVLKEAEQKTNIGGGWHTDHSYDLVPAMGSILMARETPPMGGDTLFASMAAAFDALSPGLQRTLRTLRAVHSSKHVFGVEAGYAKLEEFKGRFGNSTSAQPDVVHPVVIKHPESGREVLYVNSGFTTRFEDWTVAESQDLLKTLYTHASRPEFSCRLQWEEGTIAFWDNRSTWHYALNDYHGARRLMHRITVQGTAIEGSALLG
jgi:taurine dioxygenase